MLQIYTYSVWKMLNHYILVTSHKETRVLYLIDTYPKNITL